MWNARNAKFNMQKCGNEIMQKMQKLGHVAPSQLKSRLPSVFVVAIFVGNRVVIGCSVFIV